MTKEQLKNLSDDELKTHWYDVLKKEVVKQNHAEHNSELKNSECSQELNDIELEMANRYKVV